MHSLYRNNCWTCGNEYNTEGEWLQCGRCEVWNCPDCLYGCWFFLSHCEACNKQYCNLCGEQDACPDCGTLGDLIYAYGEHCRDKKIIRWKGYWYFKDQLGAEDKKAMGILYT